MDSMLSFEDAVEAVKKDRSSSYIGFFICTKRRFSGWYEISVDEDDEDPDFVGILYQGGMLFSSEVEDETYSSDDVPDEARSLRYMDSKKIRNMFDFTSDYALYTLFPELPDPEKLWGNERDEFLAAAVKIARDSGRATVLETA